MAAERKSPEYRFRKIVAGTDFSDTAAVAAAWAAEIARAHGGELFLTHAVHLEPPFPDYIGPQPDTASALREAARARLEDAAGKLESKGLKLAPRLLVGRAEDAILAALAEEPADLLVIGTKGLSGLPHLLLGSTAQRLVQQAPCPVLTVRGRTAPRLGRIRNVLVPTDFSEDARQASHAARDLLAPEEKGARIVLLNAYQLPIEYTAYGTAPISPAFLEEARVRAEADLEEMARPLRREGMTVETLAKEGYPSHTIVTTADEGGFDLVAMGTHGRSGLAHLLWGSTAERVVQRAPCPVLTVRRQ